MSQTSPILNLPYIQPAQAQKHVTHNEAIAALEIAVQLSVQAHTVSTPPTAPSLGARYIVPAGGGASWGASAGDVAVWDGSGWNFITPQEGWQAYTSEGPATLQFNGAEWVEAGRAETADIFGINATADAVNRLSVASEATLLNHVGAGHQVKVNKASETDTGSLLFQTNWSGRAEMGTLGNDNFEIKVSGDGNTWITGAAICGGNRLGQRCGGAIRADRHLSRKTCPCRLCLWARECVGGCVGDKRRPDRGGHRTGLECGWRLCTLCRWHPDLLEPRIYSGCHPFGWRDLPLRAGELDLSGRLCQCPCPDPWWSR